MNDGYGEIMMLKGVGGGAQEYIYYIGGWENNTLQGENGLAHFRKGETYEGGYKDGKKHGTGKYVHSTGNVYYGEWIEDRREGQGKFYFFNRPYWFDGIFKDLPQGHGVFHLTGDISYTGDWDQGVRTLDNHKIDL